MTRIDPCPFCGGPPVTWAKSILHGSMELREEHLGDPDGVWIEAVVHCHECGAEGPAAEDSVFDMAGAAELRQQAVALWNQRDTRHADLYAAGEAEGLNLYPRSAA